MLFCMQQQPFPSLACDCSTPAVCEVQIETPAVADWAVHVVFTEYEHHNEVRPPTISVKQQYSASSQVVPAIV